MVLALAVGLAWSVAACRTPNGDARGAGQDWSTEGPLYAVDGQTWVVGDRLVSVPPETTVNGAPRVGVVVRLSGKRSATGALRADAVEVVTPTPQPAARPTAPPAPAPTGVRQTRPTPAPQRPPGQRRGGGGDEQGSD